MLSADKIVNGLYTFYPDIYLDVVSKISEIRPEVTCESKVNRVCQAFCIALGISRNEVSLNVGLRIELLLVVLLFVEPDKLLLKHHKNRKTKISRGIIPVIAKFCGCSEGSIRNLTSKSIFYYQDNYMGIRDDVDRAKSHIQDVI